MGPLVSTTNERTRRILRRGIVFLLYAITAGVVLFVFVFRPGINWYERATFKDMVYGNAYRPYVYRTLVPSTVRIISEVTPTSLKSSVRSAGERTRVVRMLGWEPELLYEYGVAIAVMFGCFVAFAFVLRCLIRQFYQFPPFVTDFAPVVGLIVLPVFFRYYSHLYDPATLLLFSLALACLTSDRLVWFYIVFVLAIFNKETSVLLIVLFAIKERSRIHVVPLAIHVLVLSILWIGARVLLMWEFQNNPGSFVEFHLFDHTAYLISNPLSIVYLLVVLLVFGVLVRDGWETKPAFLRHGLFVMLVPLMILAVFLGSVDETRSYYEAYPFAFLLVVPTIVRLFGINRSANQRNVVEIQTDAQASP